MCEHWVCPFQGCPTICKTWKGLTYHTRLKNYDTNRVDHHAPVPLSPSLPSLSPPLPSPLPLPYPPLPSPLLLPSHSPPPSSLSPLPPPRSPPLHPQTQGLQDQHGNIPNPFLNSMCHILQSHH